jgi:hypothetical protein
MGAVCGFGEFERFNQQILGFMRDQGREADLNFLMRLRREAEASYRGSAKSYCVVRRRASPATPAGRSSSSWLIQCSY